jgi:hypothetical protein
MTTHPPEETDFTIRTANQTLPLVKMIVQDIVALSREVSETRERLEHLSEGRDDIGVEDEYSKELSSIEQNTELKSNKVDQYIQELTDLRLGATAVTDGFVDFPATRENETVFLCWHLGDKEVMYWHRRDEACAVRRPVDLPLIRQNGDRHYSNLA